jgi:hypothetical protein
MKTMRRISRVGVAASITRNPIRADYEFSEASRSFRIIDNEQETI